MKRAEKLGRAVLLKSCVTSCGVIELNIIIRGVMMIYYENITKSWGGIKKLVERKKQMGQHIFTIREKYFLGIRYSEKSEMRMPSIFDKIIHSFAYGGSEDYERIPEKINRIK